jgi:hypothetical protein
MGARTRLLNLIVAATALIGPACARWLLEHQRLQPRHDGYHTPNIDRIANEGA